MKISVVTVCYNAEDEIEETIKSILNQTFNNIEYIIIDGGSTDGTINIIKKYENQIAYWISEPDRGIYDAMNKGISIATGDYVINMNVGDQLITIPEQELERELQSKSVAVCGKIRTDQGNIHTPKYTWLMKLQNQLPHQALFYKTKYTRLYNIHYKIVGDYDLNLELYKRHKTIKIIDTVVAKHSLDGISRSSASEKESLSVTRKYFGKKWQIFSWIYRRIKSLMAKMRRHSISVR